MSKQAYINLAIKQVAEAFDVPADLVALYYARPRKPKRSTITDAMNLAIDKAAALAQVDDVLICNWITVKDNDYRKALNDLTSFAIQIENDPTVSTSAASRRNLINSLNESVTELKAENKRLRRLLAEPRHGDKEMKA